MHAFVIRFLFLIATFSQSAFAAPRNSLTQSMPKPHTERSSWSLLIPSFVVHGIQPEGLNDEIQRKVDPGGDVVITPGIGLEFKTAGGFTILGAVIRDCYDNLAGAFQIGKSFRITRTASWGLSAGIYARETPIFCDEYGRDCREEENVVPKFITYINGESVDVIPLPFLHFSYTFYQDADVELRLKFMGNFALNEFGLEVPF
jgi:hypothetical protein